MVSIYPNSQIYNMTHMYNINDLRGKPVKPVYPDNTIMGYISSSEHFTLFSKIICKSKMDGKLSDKLANRTLFAVSDNDLRKKYPDSYFDTIDDGFARHIIRYSTLDRKIDKDILTASPICLFNTFSDANKMCVTNIYGQTMIDSNIRIVHFNQPVDNGIVHIVNDLLVPKYLI